MSLMTKVDYLEGTKSDIRNSIISMGVEVPDTLPFRNYSDKIKQIGGGSADEWQPQADWWNIDKILENDSEDASAKIIILLNDNTDYTTFAVFPNTYKIVCSDGKTYTNNNTDNTNITHTWDKTKDKECSLGYKTRYIILYFKVSDITIWNINFSTEILSRSQPLYMIFKDFTRLHEPRYISSLPSLEAIKFINTKSTFSDLNLDGDKNIKTVIGYQNSNLKRVYCRNCYLFDRESVDYSTVDNVNSLYNSYNYSNIIVPKSLDMSKIGNYSDFINSQTVLTLNKLDFTSAKTFSITAPCLVSIEEILGQIKIPVSFSTSNNLNHDTLIRILNALYDYSTDTENTYTLTLGTTNLAKLTDEEKAIATNKGWTLS